MEWSLKWLSREMLEASALLMVVQGGEPHTSNTRFGSIFAALQMRRSNEQGSLSKMSECTRVKKWALMVHNCWPRVTVQVEIVLQYPRHSKFCLWYIWSFSLHLRSDSSCQVDSVSLMSLSGHGAQSTLYSVPPGSCSHSMIEYASYLIPSGCGSNSLGCRCSGF